MGTDKRLWGVMRCPRCGSTLAGREDGGARCEGCGCAYAFRDGYLDVMQVAGEPDAAPPTLAQRLMESRAFVRFYETTMRPFFARLFAGARVPSPFEEFQLHTGWHDLQNGGSHWLDLSCGAGYFSRQAKARAPDSLVVGLDISREMLRQAAEEAEEGDTTVWIRGDVYALPFRDGAFDGVLNPGSLHLYPDPVGAYRAIHRVLRPGGTYTASTFADSDRAIARGAAKLFSVRRTDLQRLRGDLESVGFEDVVISNFGDAFVVYARKAE